MDVKCIGRCAQITMRNGENRTTSEFIESFHRALDAVEKWVNFQGYMHLYKMLCSCRFEDVTHLVTTGEGKFFSTGVDVGLFKSPDPHSFLEILSQLQKLLARLLTFPLVTVAAINGHCVGGGVMLALSHDYRVMRRDRGWLFIPIVKLGHTLPVGLLSLAKSKVTQPAVHHMVTTAQRFSAEDGHKAGFINEVTSMPDLVDTAHRRGCKLAQDLDGRTLSAIKHQLYDDLYHMLTEPIRFTSHL